MEYIRIGLFGFGRTGKIVANEIIREPGFSLSWVVRRTHADENKYASTLLGHETASGRIFSIDEIDDDFYLRNPVDIIIDFSNTRGVHYYTAAADSGIKIISAISKYEDEDLEALLSLSDRTAVLHSPNITLGVNFLLIASQVLQKIAPHADIEVVEEHFRDKAEVSGTAKKIATCLNLDERKHINSIRVGGIVGKHEIIFGLPNQTIRLVHESINRAAFGQGAIYASRWLYNQSPGRYSMENIITSMFTENIPVY